MGANNSTRRVSFETDENENVTVVKGVRLSENVINRMREPTVPPKRQHAPSSPPPKAPPLIPSPLLRPVPSLFDPITSLPPPPPVVEPPPAPSAETAPPPQQVAAPISADMAHPSPSQPTSLPPPPAPASSNASAVINEITPPAPPPLVINPSPPLINQPIPSHPESQPNASSPVIESIAPSSVAEPIPYPLPVKIEPMTASPPADSKPPSSLPTLEPATILQPPSNPAGDTSSPQLAEPIASPPLSEFTATCEPVAPHSQPPVEPVSPAPVPEPVAAPGLRPAPPITAPPAVDEEALRKKISDELHKGFEQERAKAERELQAWLDMEKARIAAQVNADAQSQVKNEVSRFLSEERALAKDDLQQAIIRERIAAEDDRRRAQLFAKQLEAKEADLRKQDAFYRDQVSRLEERSAKFYKVTTENYHKAADEVNAKFKRYEVFPVCADLQAQILACYRENAGKTLNCSNIAALYLHCVNNAKQNKLRTGG